jgi:hypothetical protein
VHNTDFTVRYDPSTDTQTAEVIDVEIKATVPVISANPSSVNLHDIITNQVNSLSFALTNSGI